MSNTPFADLKESSTCGRSITGPTTRYRLTSTSLGLPSCFTAPVKKPKAARLESIRVVDIDLGRGRAPDQTLVRVVSGA